ncbi:histidine triad nucleotide-binding protein [Spirochaetota bacterium]
MMDCIFCKIIAGEIPSKKVYEDDNTLAFDDIDPKAPVHVLIVPKKHIVNLDGINSDNSKIMSDIFETVSEVTKIKGVHGKGYRIIINSGKSAGQEVFHLHVHVLGGRERMGPMLKKDG